jgi:hypothetical protein
MDAAVTFTEIVPVAGRLTVMSWHTATGFCWSTTVTVNAQLAVLVFTSVAVNVLVSCSQCKCCAGSLTGSQYYRQQCAVIVSCRD